jgi:transcriptional regulator with XRE-family HTH domain
MFETKITDYILKLEEKAKKKGLSRRQWLKLCNVSQSTFWRWEQGHTAPNGNTIKRLEQSVK